MARSRNHTRSDRRRERSLGARAQKRNVPTIGVLVIGNISPEQFWREFRQGLRDLGYFEGQNIRFEFRSADGHLGRLPALAAELVRLKVDIIVTWFTPTALAARQATHEIPIVMAAIGPPRDGPGECDRSLLQTLPEQIRLGGEATQTTINAVSISSSEEFEAAFTAMEKDRPDAIIVQPSLPTQRAAELALKHRVPAVSVPRWFAEEGGLMSYSAVYVELFRKAMC